MNHETTTQALHPRQRKTAGLVMKLVVSRLVLLSFSWIWSVAYSANFIVCKYVEIYMPAPYKTLHEAHVEQFPRALRVEVDFAEFE
jgi:hypothetical protein